MITYKVAHKETTGFPTALCVKGHAEVEEGDNLGVVVCAAVSTAVTFVANAFDRFKVLHTVQVMLKEGHAEFTAYAFNGTVSLLLLTLEDCFKNLEKQYPKHIQKGE